MATIIVWNCYTSNMLAYRIDWKKLFYTVLGCVILVGSSEFLCNCNRHQWYCCLHAVARRGWRNYPHFCYITASTDIFQRYSSQVISIKSMRHYICIVARWWLWKFQVADSSQLLMSVAEVQFSPVLWGFPWTWNWTYGSVQANDWTLDWTIGSGPVQVQTGSNL